MELRVLRYFLTVAKEETITQAAKLLHITQPTLSRQLSELEEELGVQLFQRGKRKITLTKQGMLLRSRAEELIGLADKTEQEVGASSLELSGTLSIGAAETMATKILPPLFSALHERYPLVRFDIISGNADQMKERIDLGLMDVALLLEPVELDRYHFLRLPETDRWGVLIPAGSPLTKKQKLTVEDLGNTPIFTSGRETVRSELSGCYGESFDKLNVMVTHNLIRNSARLVEAGLGFAITHEGAVDIYDAKKVCFRPLTPEFPSRAVLAWKKGSVSSPVLSAFLDCARELIKNPPDYRTN